MGYKIEDFPNSDWNQYFEGTYVKALTKKGVPRVGRITGFSSGHRSPHVIMRDDTGTFVVPMSSVRWSGILSTRCVAVNNSLCFIAHSGVRYHKKPPTSRNLLMLSYYSVTEPPQLKGDGMVHGGIGQQAVAAYLNDTGDYPDNYQDVEVLINHDQCAIPLSSRRGLLYSMCYGKIMHIKDGLVVEAGEYPIRDIIIRALEEARNDC